MLIKKTKKRKEEKTKSMHERGGEEKEFRKEREKWILMFFT